MKIFFNGKIHSMDENNKICTGMVVKEGKIIKMGSDREVLAFDNSTCEKVDLKGKTVIPGLIETHTHITRVGLSELYSEKYIPLSVKDLLDYTKGEAERMGPGKWIYFNNTYPTRLKEYRFPTLEELDRVAPDNPVYVDGAYAGQANSCLLRLLNIDENTPQPETGRFIKDTETGKLTGLLFRCSDLIRGVRPAEDYSIEEIKKGFINIQREYNRFGITSAIDAMSNKNDIRAINELYGEERLSLRMAFTGLVGSVDTALPHMDDLKGTVTIPEQWSRVSFMKLIVDGGILTGTAYMRKPYRDDRGVFGINFDDFRGIIQYDRDEIEKYVDLAYKGGLQMTAHCIGDGAIDEMMAAYETYHKKHDIRNRRFSIIHCDFTDDETLENIKDMNIYILFQPAWHYMDAELLTEVIDRKSMENFIPYAKYLKYDVKAAAGSDHMVKYDSILSQNPFNPFIALYNMVTRKTRNNVTVDGENAISREDALAMYTARAAHVTFEEDFKGTLEPGKAADFVVLSQDYFTCSEEEIKTLEAVMTYVDGRIVYES